MSPYRILIVDDEVHAIKGVQSGVYWEGLNISQVYTANSLRQAQEIFKHNHVDLMLCDIEMPKGSGIELLEWVRGNYPGTEAIFLTCHSDFSYARQAMQLKSLNYLLKPVDFQELSDAIEEALNKINQDREAKQIDASYQELRTAHQSIMLERFWLDVVHQIVPTSIDKIQAHMQNNQIAYPDAIMFLPVLFHVHRWILPMHEEGQRELILRQELERGMKMNKRDAIVLNLGTDSVLMILPVLEPISIHALEDVCHLFVLQFAETFHCELCCYIGDQGRIDEVPGIVGKLTKLERNNVTSMNQTLILKKVNNDKFSIPSLPFSEWTNFMKAGAQDKLLEEIKSFFEEWEHDKHITAQSLHLFYQSFLQMVFHVLHVKGIEANQVYSQNLLTEKPEKVLKSFQSWKEWIIFIVSEAMSQIHPAQEKGMVVELVKQYIQDNLSENLSREDIANHVYLNPDYLTRVFKKQTGYTISDYLQHQRIEYAKTLLVETELSVSEVALNSGFPNFSYFSTIFKRMTDENPKEYRKKRMISEKS